jgi:hypothetical protein
MLREVARVIADDMDKRVVIVDTSNEIAGDGDIPHPAIGQSRRMQVRTPALQHAVMIEAVENHMPEVIVIDEIGTELEAAAARTIAERGVQLVATAHGNELENLVMNPTLSIVSGIQSVTLGDEARPRHANRWAQSAPTFDIVVNSELGSGSGARRRGGDGGLAAARIPDGGKVRELGETRSARDRVPQPVDDGRPRAAGPPSFGERDRRPYADDGGGNGAVYAARELLPDAPFRRVYPFGIARKRLEQAVRETGARVAIAAAMNDADTVITLRTYFRRKPQALRDAESRGIPIYVLKTNTVAQMEQSLLSMQGRPDGGEASAPSEYAMQEMEDAIANVLNGGDTAVDLTPQNSYIRRLQHQMAQRYNLTSRSQGREPYRRVRLYREDPGEAWVGSERF